MARGIWAKERRVEACKKETLEDAVEYLLEEEDIKGANPYTSEVGKYSLVQLVSLLKKHNQLKNKSERRRNDILRNVLNEMMSIIRIGSTRKARYSFDSEGGGSEAREILDRVLRALLVIGGEAKWDVLQRLVKVDEKGGITHLEFNSAVNYLVDNGVVEKVGSRANREADEKGVRKITPDSRRVVCTAKAWGWQAGVITYSEDESLDLFTDTGRPVGKDAGWDTEDYQEIVVGGSEKKTHSIVLTERTSKVLEELNPILDTLPDADRRKPANINRSTIIEVALWTLYRQIKISEGEGSDVGEVTLPELAQRLVELTEKIDGLVS